VDNLFLKEKTVLSACHYRWIFYAASGFGDHSLYHLLFSRITRKADVADEPVLLQIIPDCFKRLTTKCLQAPSL
jgi:hypothetical protein